MSSEIFGLLGNIGGALGAQAAGGPQGLANFLNGIQNNQLAAAERNFKRESASRDRAFQASRDRLAHKRRKEEKALDRAHDAAMRGEDKQDQRDQVVNLLITDTSSNPAVGDAMVASLVATNPELGPSLDGYRFNEDPSRDRELTALYVGSVGAQQAQQSAAGQADETTTRRDTYETLTGIALDADEATPSREDVANLQRRRDSEQTKLTSAQDNLTILSNELTAINRLPAEERGEPLAKLSARLESQQTKLGTLGESPFIDESGFATTLNAVLGTYAAQARALEIAQLMVTKDLSAAYDFKEGLSGWSGAGGTTNEQFSAATAAAAPTIKEMDRVLAVLRDTDPEILKVLGYSNQKGIRELLERVNKAEVGQQVDAATMLKAYHTASAEGDTTVMADVDEDIKALAHLSSGEMTTKIANHTEWVGQLAAAEVGIAELSSGVLGTVGFGFDAAKALDTFGVATQNPSGVKRWDPIISPRKMFADPTVQQDLAKNLFAGLPYDGEYDRQALVMDRIDLIAKQNPTVFTPNSKRSLVAAAKSVEQRPNPGGIEPAVSELTDYRDTYAKNLAGLGATGSPVSVLEPDEQEQHRKRVQDSVKIGTGDKNPLAQRDTLDKALSIVRAPLSKSRKGSWYNSEIQFDAEAESDGSTVTPRDIHEIFREFVPGYSSIYKASGSPSQQSQVVSSPSGYPGWRVPATFRTQTADWAKGDTLKYIRGSESLVKQAETRNYDLSSADVAMLQYMDLQRGIQLEDLAPDMTTEEYTMLQGMQVHLRTQTLDEVLSAAEGGFLPEDLGLDPLSMDANEADAVTGKAAFAAGQLDQNRLSQEIESAKKGLSQLNAMQSQQGLGTVVDLQVGPGERYAILDEVHLAEEQRSLQEDIAILEATKIAEEQLDKSGMDATSTLAVLVGGGSASFPTNAAGLAEVIRVNLPITSGESLDVMAQLNSNAYTSLRTNLEDQPDADPFFLFDQVMSIVNLQASSANQALGRGSNVAISDKVAFAEAQGRRFAGASDKVMDFYLMLEDDPDYRSHDAPPAVRNFLRRNNFDDMPSSNSTERKYRALALWSAAYQAYN